MYTYSHPRARHEGLPISWDGAGGGLQVTLEEDAGATGEGGADRMSEQFAALLGAVLEAPGAELDDPDIVGPRERRLLTKAFRGPVVSVPEPWWPVHLAIADLARTDPARPAVADGDTRDRKSVV